MKRRELTLLTGALMLMLVSAGTLLYFKAHQRLGKPGLKVTPIAGSIRVNIEMPTNALGFKGAVVPVDEVVTKTLPVDTSIAQIVYTNTAGSAVFAVAVTMGTDRTSIHKPQYCLRAQGYTIDESLSEETTLRIYRPQPVDLPVVKLVAYKEAVQDGKPVRQSCVFVYWLVCEDQVTANRANMGWRITEHMLRTGELQRWSYVFYMAGCPPGREDAALALVTKAISATLPEYQLAWPPARTAK